MLYLHLNDGLQSFGFCRLRRPFKAPMKLLEQEAHAWHFVHTIARNRALRCVIKPSGETASVLQFWLNTLSLCYSLMINTVL